MNLNHNMLEQDEKLSLSGHKRLNSSDFLNHLKNRHIS